MKKIFSILAVVLIFSACSNNAKKEALIKQQAITAMKDSLKLDSFRKAEAVRVAQVQEEKAREEKRMLLLSERNEAAASRSSSTEAATTTETKKKGWSQAAKGAAIGAGAGAIGGILLDKKDARGAIIGGVVGAGTGYVIGRAQDRKSGRVQPKN